MGRDEQYAARMQLLGLVAEGQLTADEGAQRLAVLTRVGSTPLPAENRYPWRDLLTRWNADLLAEPQIVARLPAEVIQSGWLGAPGATDEELRRAEARLGANLPPSYRSFLKVSNGWWSTGFFIQRIWPAEQVEWYRTRRQEWIDAWRQGEASQGGPLDIPDDEYYVYGSEQNVHTIRSEYMQTALEISDEGYGGSGMYLLNPRVVSAEGEWEAWFLAAWQAGAARYRSFWDMMVNEYASFRQLRDSGP